MPTIFDNIETVFLENAAHNGLRDALKVARRGDFCVGYFNLRGWKHIDDVVVKRSALRKARSVPLFDARRNRNLLATS